MTKPRLGVALFQLGGPDSLEAIKPFLKNIFSDPDIISFRLGGRLRRAVAGLIAEGRAPRVAKYYREIGGRSPILDITLGQAAALEAALSDEYDCRVVTAMRYSEPYIGDAVSQLADFTPDKVVLLPLYPQYSKTTTGSSFNEWDRQGSKKLFPFKEEKKIFSFHLDQRYIDAVVARINEGVQFFDGDAKTKLHFLFSAHGLPKRYLNMGDPYKNQIEETVSAVMSRGGFGNSHSLAYQSRIGPVKWLQPFVQDEVVRLAGMGVRDLLVIPISFVSDHLETLHELGIKLKDLADREGIKSYRVAPSLNDSPQFIDALKSLVMKQVEGPGKNK
jgi:ferrochelatase